MCFIFISVIICKRWIHSMSCCQWREFCLKYPESICTALLLYIRTMKLNFCWYCNCLYDCCIYMMPADFCISLHFVVDAIFRFWHMFWLNTFFPCLFISFALSMYHAPPSACYTHTAMPMFLKHWCCLFKRNAVIISKNFANFIQFHALKSVTESISSFFSRSLCFHFVFNI